MKRKILVCVLACATLFLGMGYAYWTDSLQIDTKATTGNLEVKFVDLAVFGQYGNEELGWAINNGIPGAPGAANNYFDRGTQYNIPWEAVDMNQYKASIANYTKTDFTAALKSPISVVPAGADNAYGPTTNASDGFDVSITDIYPGYAQIFRTDIINIGTLAARLSDVKVQMGNVSGAHLDDMIGVSLKVVAENSQLIKVLDPTDASQYFTIGGEKFVRLSALNSVGITEGLGDDTLYIYPGTNTMDAYLGVAMDPDYDGAFTTGHVGLTPASDKVDANTQLKEANFRINFLWDQFNTPAAQ